MPKIKTHQATRKRIKITKSKKFLQRTAGQDHFNAPESGRITKLKRRNHQASPANLRALKKLIPHH